MFSHALDEMTSILHHLYIGRTLRDRAQVQDTDDISNLTGSFHSEYVVDDRKPGIEAREVFLSNTGTNNRCKVRNGDEDEDGYMSGMSRIRINNPRTTASNPPSVSQHMLRATT